MYIECIKFPDGFRAQKYCQAVKEKVITNNILYSLQRKQWDLFLINILSYYYLMVTLLITFF